MTDPNVAKVWDIKRNVNYNYAKMGLSTLTRDENIRQANPVDGGKLTKEETAIQVFDIPKDGIIPECRKHRSWRLPLNENDQKYIAVLLEKYSTDYRKMFLDIKINNKQLTETKLRSMAKSFFELNEKQRKVSVSDKVRQHFA